MGRRGKKKGRPVAGWLILDKPWDFGSTLPSYESMSDFDEDDPSSMAEWAEGMRQDMGDEFGSELDDLSGSSED